MIKINKANIFFTRRITNVDKNLQMKNDMNTPSYLAKRISLVAQDDFLVKLNPAQVSESLRVVPSVVLMKGTPLLLTRNTNNLFKLFSVPARQNPNLIPLMAEGVKLKTRLFEDCENETWIDPEKELKAISFEENFKAFLKKS